MKLYLVGSAIWSILHEAASRGPSALAYILVPCCIAYPRVLKVWLKNEAAYSKQCRTSLKYYFQLRLY